MQSSEVEKPHYNIEGGASFRVAAVNARLESIAGLNFLNNLERLVYVRHHHAAIVELPAVPSRVLLPIPRSSWHVGR